MADSPDKENLIVGGEDVKIEGKVVGETIEVSTVINGESHTYIFKIPTIRDSTRMGVRERDLRMADSGSGNGSEVGIDIVTELLYRSLALFEVLLIKSSDARMYTESPEGKIIVDSSKFGPSIDPLLLIGVQQGFEQALTSFRKNRA